MRYQFELRGRSDGSIEGVPVKVVGICEFQGSLIVATENHVYRMVDGKLVPIPFIVHEQPPSARIEDRFEQSPQG